MLPRRIGQTPPEREPPSVESLLTGVACSLVLGLFVAMTVGRGWLGAAPEGPVCRASCR